MFLYSKLINLNKNEQSAIVCPLGEIRFQKIARKGLSRNRSCSHQICWHVRKDATARCGLLLTCIPKRKDARQNRINYQNRVRYNVRANVALHSRKRPWQLRHPHGKMFHIFPLGRSRNLIMAYWVYWPKSKSLQRKNARPMICTW